MTIKPLLTLLPIFCLCIPAHAEIYRWIDEAGNVIYSDQPRQGAETVKLPGMTTFSGPPVPTNSRQVDSTQDQDELTKYTSIKFRNPVNDTTIRENSGRVEVSLSLTPGLGKDHSVVYDLDGQLFKIQGVSYTFTNVGRGTHTLKAHVVDAKGKKVSPVASTTFHLKRISVLNKPKAQ